MTKIKENIDIKKIGIKKKYKIQIPKGKAVVTAKIKVDNDNAVMTIDVDFTSKKNCELSAKDRRKLHELLNHTFNPSFEELSKSMSEVTKSVEEYYDALMKDRGFVRIATEKLEQAAKEYIKEHDKQIDKILKMADDKDARAVANMILQEYGENICRKKQPKCPRTLSELKLIDEIYESISKRSKELIELCDIKQQKYKPKDGDFVYVKAGYEHIVIFKNIKGNDLYVYVECNNVTTNFVCANLAMPICHIKDIKEIRPATEEEKKLLIDKLAERNKKWNAETKQIEDVRWRAKVGETFYYIDTLGMIMSMERFDRLANRDPNSSKLLELYKTESAEDILWKKGNYFMTREAAEKVAKQIREIFKNSKAE